MTTQTTDFLALAVHHHDVGTAEIAYRKVGSGPPLVLLHGWPLWGFTWRNLLPHLTPRFTCYVVDLPGGGLTRWRDEHDFRFASQARAVARLVEGLGLDAYDLVAHDTGATIAREVALTTGGRVRRLVLFNTEIPGHRPPWVRFFQTTSRLPGANATFRALLRSRAFLRSAMAFGNSFADLGLLDGDFGDHIVAPLLADPRRLEGQIRYLRGIDWALVDGLAVRHAQLTQPLLFIWGEDDPTFPLARARAMERQIPGCAGFRAIGGAKLLVHEERPAEVSEHLLAFLD